jgi:hypothetical protein
MQEQSRFAREYARRATMLQIQEFVLLCRFQLIHSSRNPYDFPGIGKLFQEHPVDTRKRSLLRSNPSALFQEKIH